VNNALNIVAVASKDHPLVDEQGKALSVQQMVKGSIVSGDRGYGGYGTGDSSSGDVTISAPKFPTDSYQMQQKINEKTAIIKKYLANDPRTKKLNPYVEVITLDNMIDVPVIVGTKDYQVDTLSLAFVLATALALKKPLNSWTNAQFVFNVIENTKEEDAWGLFVSLVDKKQSGLTERLLDYLGDSYPRVRQKIEAFKGRLIDPMKRLASGVEKTKEFGRTYISPVIPKTTDQMGRKRQSDPEVLRHQDISVGRSSAPSKYVGAEDDAVYQPGMPFKTQSQFDILSVVKDNLAETKLFFKFMLNDDLLRSQFGLEKSPGQMTTAVNKVSEHARTMLASSHKDFMMYLRTNIEIAMSSIFWTLYPWNSNIEYAEIKDFYINGELAKDTADILGELGGALEGTFNTSHPDNASKMVKRINKICQRHLESTYKELRDLGNKMDAGMSIRNHAFSPEQFGQFYKTIDSVTSKYTDLQANLSDEIGNVISEADRIISFAINVITKAVDGMLKEYTKAYIPVGSNPFHNTAVYANKMDAKPNDEGAVDLGNGTYQKPLILQRLIPDYIEGMRQSLISIIAAHFFATCISAICSFAEHIEVEVETVANDALDLPNYSLVVPVETIAMLHAAAISKSWRDLVQGGQTQNTNLTDNYIKGIVKFINKRLDVPNLIVIDSKRGHVYYKLQYMSQVNKTNIRTFETYVKSMTQTELQGNQY
jgi:hypothetical protein